jgi:hypothetical protein
MSIIILVKYVSPQHRRPPSLLAAHCLPQHTQDPVVVSPLLPTTSLDAPQDPTVVSPVLLADCGRRHYRF